MNDKNAQDLLICLEELNKRRREGERTRNQSLQGMEVPPTLQGLTVFQPDIRLWQDPPFTADLASTLGKASIDGLTDNSNTQFALLGLWAARRHGVVVEPVLEIVVERFERSQIYPTGFWKYQTDRELGATSRMSMTCVGLIGLAIGRGLKLPTSGSPADGAKDVHVLRGLACLSRQIGKPRGGMNKRVELEDLYFLWSLERAAMLFNLPDIGGKDWYRWGAEGLVTNQKTGGWWPGAPLEKRLKKVEYKATLNTSFALLFLKCSHPMKDLTAKLPFTARELNEGIARLRPRDAFPIRTRTTPSPSRNQGP